VAAYRGACSSKGEKGRREHLVLTYREEKGVGVNRAWRKMAGVTQSGEKGASYLAGGWASHGGSAQQNEGEKEKNLALVGKIRRRGRIGKKIIGPLEKRGGKGRRDVDIDIFKEKES